MWTSEVGVGLSQRGDRGWNMLDSGDGAVVGDAAWEGGGSLYCLWVGGHINGEVGRVRGV